MGSSVREQPGLCRGHMRWLLGLVHFVCVQWYFEGAMECPSALQEGGSNAAGGCCQHNLALGPDLGEDEVDEVCIANATQNIEENDVIVVFVGIVPPLKNFEECINLSLVVGVSYLVDFLAESQFFLVVIQPRRYSLARRSSTTFSRASRP